MKNEKHFQGAAMKILNFGSLRIEEIFTVDSFVRPGEETAALALEEQPGGRGLCQSIAISRAGSLVIHAGKTAPDGRKIIDFLKKNGVKTAYIEENGSCTGRAVIQVNKYGSSSVLLHAGANQEITKTRIDYVLDGLSAGDILILQNELNNIEYIIEKAYAKYIRIVLNPTPINDALKDCLSKVSYLILNELEGEELTGESRPNKMLDYLITHYPHLKTVLTLGKIGSLYSDKLLRLQQSIFPVESVDTTAVGDTYLGYFISRISMGVQVWNAMREAAKASALTVSRQGGVKSIPTWKEVIDFSSMLRSRA
jgi:ribokinase